MKRLLPIACLALTLSLNQGGDVARAQVLYYVGDQRMFPLSWCPSGWAPADGSLVDIAKAPALFSRIGITFGGDGRTKFALPDLTLYAAPNTLWCIAVTGGIYPQRP